MDRKGDIGLGYSFGGDPNYPGQRFAARLAKDPKGQLTFHESVLAEGQASQTGSLRWEDFTNIIVDPSDDCTFWYTRELSEEGRDVLYDAHRIVRRARLQVKRMDAATALCVPPAFSFASV